MDDTWTTRFDVSEVLEAADWIGDADNPLEILRKNGATWAVINDAADSQLGADGWNIQFPSDAPAVVIVAACLAAAGQQFTAPLLRLVTEDPS
jgi:hypothetical protein